MTPQAPRYPYVHVDVPADEAERWSAELWELGALGIEERDMGTLIQGADEASVTLVAAFEDEVGAGLAVRAMGDSVSARLHYVVGDGWRDEWKRFFKPRRFGERIVITPSWEVPDLKEGDICVAIEPGNAFGSGMHETTGLVLHALEEGLCPGSSVLDVGCGSGILGIVAAKMGASRVVAIDVAPEAIVATEENAERNEVPIRIEASTHSLLDVEGEYDLVLANIQAHVLIELAPALIDRMSPGGRLVLSGVLTGQADAVRAVFGELGRAHIAQDGEWVSITLSNLE